MIGSSLGLDLPLLSDTLTTIVSKTATALSAIETSIADLATQAAINISDDFSLGGNQLTNVGGVTLVAGHAPTAVGSIYYASNEFYAVDATGIIQLTSSGALNIVAARGFTGDYGQPGVTAEAKFDNASGQYRFYKSTGVYGDVVAADVLLQASGGAIKLKPNAGAGNYTLTLAAALPGTDALAQVSSAGAVSYSNTVVNAATFSAGITVGADTKFTGFTRTVSLPLSIGRATHLNNTGFAVNPGGGDTTGTTLDNAAINLVSSGAWEFISDDLNSMGLVAGDRVKSIRVIHRTVAGTFGIGLYKLALSSGSYGTGTLVASTSGQTSADYTMTVGSPVAIAAGERWFIDLSGTTTGDKIVHVEFTYDHP